jgi:hypothetical protein
MGRVVKKGSVAGILRVLTKQGGDDEKTGGVSSQIRSGFFGRLQQCCSQVIDMRNSKPCITTRLWQSSTRQGVWPSRAGTTVSIASIVRVLTKQGGDDKKTGGVSPQIRSGFFRRLQQSCSQTIQGRNRRSYFTTLLGADYLGALQESCIAGRLV